MIQDLESEKAIIGGLLRYGKNAHVEICQFVNAETFSDINCQGFFLSIEKSLSYSDKIDFPTLHSSAKTIGLDNLITENKVLLEELKNQNIELVNIRILGKKIARLALARTGQSKLITSLSQIKNVTGDETASEILAIVEKPGFELQTILNSTEESGQLIGKGIEIYVEELMNNPNIETGIATGYKEFDRIIGGGIRRGGYTLLGARPKTGKSSIAINVALYCAERLRIPVLFLDTEMQPKQHWPRMMANLTSIPIPTIEHSTFTGNKMLSSQIKDAAKRIERLPITHERVAGKSIEEIISISRRWIMKNVGFHSTGKTNNCLIIYDYFKLMTPSALKNLKEWEIMGQQATALSDFLGDFDVPCLALVQLNKEKDISQSDRLIWLALAVAMLISKTSEEIVTDGYENGNRKIITPDNYMRFGEGLDAGDYINLQFDGNLCQMKELGRAFEMKEKAKIGKAGFDVDDSDEV